SYYFARYCFGVLLYQRLNARWKELNSEKPNRKAISLIVCSLFLTHYPRSSTFGFSAAWMQKPGSRSRLIGSCGTRPALCCQLTISPTDHVPERLVKAK